MEYPTANEIELAAARKGKTMTEVLKGANVGRESFYREKRGEGRMTPRTVYKLMKAVHE